MPAQVYKTVISEGETALVVRSDELEKFEAAVREVEELYRSMPATSSAEWGEWSARLVGAQAVAASCASWMFKGARSVVRA